MNISLSVVLGRPTIALRVPAIINSRFCPGCRSSQGKQSQIRGFEVVRK